jgi:exopolysaccharide biosynthesis protein
MARKYCNNSYSRSRQNRVNPFIIVLVAVVLIGGAAIAVSLSLKGSPTGAPGTLPTDSATAQATLQGDTATPAGSSAPDTSSPAGANATASQDAGSGYFTSGDVQLDSAAMTYKSGDLYVKVTNVNENGKNYYVADCRMQSGDKLFRALAGDKYVVHTEEPSSVMALRKGAVIAINGDYYGAAAADRNGRGIMIANGQLYRSTPWYDVAAIFKDGTMKTYNKSETTADQLMASGAVQAFSFGPMLLDSNGKAIEQSMLKKRPPLVNPANPRSGIGYIEPNHFVLVVVDGRGAGGSAGMTQYEFAKLFESLGCKSAYSLDGGGSATMVFMGKVINHPCDAAGERSVSDIVYFGEKETDQANIDRMNNQ